MPTWLRYSLFQLPAYLILVLGLLFVHRWVAFPWWVGVLVISVWAVKDLVMYPLARRSYITVPFFSHAPEAGDVAVAPQGLSPEGYVQVRAELWNARCDAHVPAGARVIVQSRDGLLLQVRPEG